MMNLIDKSLVEALAFALSKDFTIALNDLMARRPLLMVEFVSATYLCGTVVVEIGASSPPDDGVTIVLPPSSETGDNEYRSPLATRS